jgi:hypothetical protein
VASLWFLAKLPAKLAFVPYCWASSFGLSVGLVGDRLSVHMIPHGNVNVLYLAELLRVVPSFVSKGCVP